jgi:hypothetical protein
MKRRDFLKAAAGSLGGLIVYNPALAQFAPNGLPHASTAGAETTTNTYVHPTLASNSQEEVGVRLVCLFDVSGSIDTAEYRTQLNAMATAIGSEDMRDATFFKYGPGSIAICVASFGSRAEMEVPWVDIRKGEDFKFAQLAEEIRNLRRRESGMTNHIAALNEAMTALKKCPWEGKRNVVDSITDGSHNEGGPESLIKPMVVQLANEFEATVNALVTLDSSGNVEDWANKNLKTPAGIRKSDGKFLDPGFVKVVATQQSSKSPGAISEYNSAMELAFRRKIFLEVAGIELDDYRAYKANPVNGIPAPRF